MKSIRRNFLKELDDILGPISEDDQKEMDAWFEEMEKREKTLDELGIKEPMRRFYFDLELLRKHGFKPIAVTVMVCENTFCFETEEEALRAHEQFEKNPKGEYISGWWYGKKNFTKAIKSYTKQMGYTEDRIIWL